MTQSISGKRFCNKMNFNKVVKSRLSSMFHIALVRLDQRDLGSPNCLTRAGTPRVCYSFWRLCWGIYETLTRTLWYDFYFQLYVYSIACVGALEAPVLPRYWGEHMHTYCDTTLISILLWRPCVITFWDLKVLRLWREAMLTLLIF